MTADMKFTSLYWMNKQGVTVPESSPRAVRNFIIGTLFPAQGIPLVYRPDVPLRGKGNLPYPISHRPPRCRYRDLSIPARLKTMAGIAAFAGPPIKAARLLISSLEPKALFNLRN